MEDTEVKNVRDIPPVQINKNSPALKARPIPQPESPRKSTYINIPFYGKFLLVNREPVSEQDNINAVKNVSKDELTLRELEAEVKRRKFARQIITEGFDPSDPAFQPVPDVAALKAEIVRLNENLYAALQLPHNTKEV